MSDILLITGLLIVASGAGWIYPPAGLIVLGAEMVALAGLISYVRHRPKTRGDDATT